MKTKATTTIFFALCLVMLFTESSSFFWRRRRRRRSPSPPLPPQRPPCVPRPCTISWSAWSGCSCPCGYGCTKTRYRRIITAANRCGSCPYSSSESTGCNREASRCQHGSRQKSYGCVCRSGWTGTCCENGECSLQA